MDKQEGESPNIIDHRSVATHTLTGFFALLLGLISGRFIAPADQDLVQIVSTALDRGQGFWSTQVNPYRVARVVIFTNSEPTPCGEANDQTGPFYCEDGERIYVDLSFLRTIKGDLARAYVIAHELGHHIQKLTGEFQRIRDSVKIELQADCLAGFWMRSEQRAGHLAAGDIDDAIAEAAAVGDDRLSPGSSPETWTHGSAAQRSAAVKVGLGGGPCKID